jgi:hypothetical protein
MGDLSYVRKLETENIVSVRGTQTLLVCTQAAALTHALRLSQLDKPLDKPRTLKR